jgi:hypothetical protein
MGSPCKRRASCLKPKEIAKTSPRFDLQGEPNYLKVKRSMKNACAGFRALARWQHDA